MFKNGPVHVRWSLLAAGAIGAVVIVTPQTIFGNDIGTFLLTALLAVVVSLVVVILFFRTVRRQSPSALLMLVVFCSVLWGLFRIRA